MTWIRRTFSGCGATCGIRTSSVPVDRPEDPGPRAQRAAERSADLALSLVARPVRQRNLEDAQPVLDGFQLHFHVPTPGGILHPEEGERAPADRAERPHVAVVVP